MQGLWSVIICYTLATLCCMTQSAAESKSTNQMFPNGVIAEANAVRPFAIKNGIRLVKSDKRGEGRDENESWKRVEETLVSGGDEPTKVKIIGNSVLVPAKLVNRGNEVDVHLLLDTGATGTMIHAEIANQLSLDLSKARKVPVQVIGGAFIKAQLVSIDSLSVGPHIKSNWNIFVVSHEGFPSVYDGLLGMDVLRDLKYRVDLNKKVIFWE